MSTPALGRLERLDLRYAWSSEAGSFTPWLAQEENLALLSETIGIDLELEAQEQQVGPFRADVLCRDSGTQTWVLIENQLERTDHIHLGQLLTYAAGLNAVTIVWIAQEFREEHRAALDWLNEITDDQFSFFGLEVELWQIGNSEPAPKFNIVCQPNDWIKKVRDAGVRTLTDTKLNQLKFWSAFREYMSDNSSLRCTKPLPQPYMPISIGKTGFLLSAVAATYEVDVPDGISAIRAELVLCSKDAKFYYDIFESEREQINADFGEPLQWYRPEQGRNCKIFVRRPAEIMDQTKWQEYHEWLRIKLEALHKTFFDRIRNLPLPSQENIE